MQEIMKRYCEILIISILVFIFTFPILELDYATGLDNSYLWGLNMLFAQDYNALLQLKYPLGPLFILKSPTYEGNNALFFLIFYTIVKLPCIAYFLYLSKKNKVKYLISIPLIYFSFLFMRVDYLIVFLCALLNLYAPNRKQNLFFVLSIILATIGLCIKSSIGLSSLIIIAEILIIDLFLHKNAKLFMQKTLLALISFTVVMLIVFHSFENLWNYLASIMYLVKGYSGNMALNPENNWVIILLGLMAMIIYPCLNRQKEVIIFFLIMLLPFFSVYKHAFVREDVFHYKQIFGFLLPFWTIMIFITKKQKATTYILPLICLSAFYINYFSIFGANTINPRFNRLKYFNDYAFHFKKQKNIMSRYLFKLSNKTYCQSIL